MPPTTEKAWDQARYSALAHRDHAFCNPLSSEKVDRVLGLLELSPGQRVLDVGCGKAEMLVRLVTRFGARAVGVDINERFLDEANAKAAVKVPRQSLELLHASIHSIPVAPESFDVALCVGSTHAYGSYRAALSALQRAVGPGGRILLGEGYWKREPDPEYLAALDATRDDFTDHAGNVSAGLDAGLISLYSCVSSEDEWDHYEGLYARAIERYAIANPDDPDRAEMLERIRRWRAAYLRWGRETLGFGLYLFAKPQS
jgi:SAM-dependent methyltransferase